MSKILEMIEKRNQAWEGAKAFVESKRDKDGLLSTEDAATYAAMEQKVKDYGAEIARLQEMEAMEQELAKPVNTPLTGKPMSTTEKPEKTGRASEAYKQAMLTALRTNFRQVSNVLSEGVDANGGYLVPEEYDRRLIDILDEENVMRKLGTRITTSGEHKINIAATKPAAAWIEEGGALTFGDATFDQIILDAHKLHVAIKVTEELLYDNAFNLESYIMQQFGKALANAEEDAFINGTGTGQPLGILAATGGADVGVTAKSATAITADELIDLIYSLKRPYRKSAAFLLNDQTLAAIRKLKDNYGQYLWQPSLQAGEPDRILGYAAYTSPYFPAVAAGKPAVAFGDFSYYNIGDRGTRSFAELKELFAGNGMVGFVAKERVDGKLVLPEAIKLLKMKAGS
ncbi:MAG: phage major capsid protein [Agathobaculum desmolans]|uniref:phage major capsid protein n=1 Tax=Agathobaculum desmolans TaxID=39484 RepID=UPI0039956B35